MRGILDALYWRLHSSYLRNEREDARRFLAMLEDEMAHGSLVSEIGAVQMGRFRKIREGITDGSFARLYGQGTDSSALDLGPPADRSGEEKDFCKKLLQDRHVLLCLLGADGADIVTELPMDPYGRCDFVIRAGRRVYVAEVKMGEAPSSVVSQIDKYRLCMELDMCLGTHDEVLAFVVAESFSPYVASELSRLDVGMIEHKGNCESMKRVS